MNRLIPVEFLFFLLINGLSILIFERNNAADKITAEQNPVQILVEIEDDERWNACLLPEQISTDLKSANGIVSKPVCYEKKEHVEFFTKLGVTMSRTSKSDGYDALIGANFNVHYNIVYIKSADLVMVNPKVLYTPEWPETKYCDYDMPNGEVIRKWGIPKKFKVSYRSIQTKLSSVPEHIFEGESTCVAWAALEALKGK